ncbi:hypothetical protein JW824_08060 [bacterium]|nr:hypothetical protein [bacterium]
MSDGGKLILYLRDVYGSKLNGRLDIHLQHTILQSESRVARDVRPSMRNTLSGLVPGIYRVSIFPTRYRPIRFFTMVQDGQTKKETRTLPVDPEKVTGIQAPEFADLPDDLKHVLNHSEVESYPDKKGEYLYLSFDHIQKAGLLNIYHKMHATSFQNGRNCFSFVISLIRVRGDRFFARVSVDFRDEVKNSLSDHLFHEADDSLHNPPVGYSRAGSFKTQDQYGNLQLSFFLKNDSLDFMIDADIDNAAGILHCFQVIQHHLTGEGTHPYDIHEILVQHQKLDPGYKLLV